ncbi:MAG: secondary thiamine-phosphate synthase enzyme YjbQ [Gammaproteobacteria bacterium]
MFQQTLDFNTHGRGTQEITAAIADSVVQSNISSGLCHLFLQHTSASLLLCENADSDVRRDLETFMQNLVPDGDPMFIHDAEGPDDMPAHIRSILTTNSLTIPVGSGRLLLGTWQGIYLWEHRQHGHQRRLVVTVQD